MVGLSKRKKRREEGTFIRVCPAATIVEKETKDAGGTGVAAAEHPSEHSRPQIICHNMH